MNAEAPSIARTVAATSVAVIISLAADAALVKIATSHDRSIRDYSHFRFGDYGTLTIIGVIAACAAWLFVVHLTPRPRTLFFRLAIVVTLALWLPDLWLLVQHENTEAVITLMAMHLLIAVITYNLLVHVAPVHISVNAAISQNTTPQVTTPQVTISQSDPPLDGVADVPDEAASSLIHRSTWIIMMIGVCLEFAAGIAALLFVPYGRSSEWISHQGETLYLVHAILGGALTICAAILLVRSLHAERFARLGAWIGLIGMALGAGGGMLAVVHSLRIAGIALMFVGGTVAFFGYITPIIEQSPSGDQSARTENNVSQ